MSTDPREFEHPIDGSGDPTPEAIEAAARVIWNDRAEEFNDPKWDDLTREHRNRSVGLYVEHLATAALSAAAPIMTAQAKAEALREAADDLSPQLREYRLGAHEVLTQKITPHGGDDTRSLQLALVAAKQTSNWLRARAETIEGKSE